jgi:hypothetical protein
MPILRERRSWSIPRRARPADLTADEQAGVRRALTALRLRHDTVARLVKALACSSSTLTRADTRPVTVAFALLVARAASAPLSDVLHGQWPAPGACMLCGHAAADTVTP